VQQWYNGVVRTHRPTETKKEMQKEKKYINKKQREKRTTDRKI